MSIALTGLNVLLSLAKRDRNVETIGESVYQDIVGHRPSEGLDHAVLHMDEDERNEWARLMGLQLEYYDRETFRIGLEQGQVDTETLGVLSKDAAARIASLRMRTRPIVVCWLVVGIMSPFILIAVDAVLFFLSVVLMALNVDAVLSEDGSWQRYGFDMSAAVFADQNLREFYKLFQGWASVIVLSYFGLRQVGKMTGSDSDDQTLGTAIVNAGKAIKQVQSQGEPVISALKEIRKRVGR